MSGHGPSGREPGGPERARGPAHTAAERDTGRKRLEAIWTRIAIDPVADRIASGLVRVAGVTPNRVTLAAGVLALAAATSFLHGWYALGGVLFQVRFLVDCVDGRIARIRGASTPWGAALDVLVDTAGVLLCFAALGTSLVADGAAGPVPFALALAGCGLYGWTLCYRKSLPGGGPRDWTAAARTAAAPPSPTGHTPRPGDDGPEHGPEGESAAGRDGGPSPGPEGGVHRRWVAAMARRGMVPTPYAVELELLALTLLPLAVPLAGDPTPAVAGLWLAAVFYAAATTLNVLRIRRLTTPTDPATPSDPPEAS